MTTILLNDLSAAQRQRLDSACLRGRADAPVSHDHLFHSVLGAMNVKTALYQRDLDLFADCKVG